MEVSRQALDRLSQRLGQIPARIQRLKKAGVKKLSRTECRQPVSCGSGKDSCWIHSDGGGERRSFDSWRSQVSQASNDNGLLLRCWKRWNGECGQGPGQVLATAELFSRREFRGTRATQD